MAGGVWSKTDTPVLPGLYLNFQSAALAAIQPGARGVVVAPIKAHWGPVREFVEITSEADITELYTDDESGSATAKATLSFALLGGASKVLAYRLASGTAAKATLTLTDTAATPANIIKIDGKYPGARANNFKITVQVNPVEGTKKDIKLYEGTTLLKTFTYTGGATQSAVDAINNAADNKWIVATKLVDGNGVVKDISSVALTGGNSGITGVATTDYTNALLAFETQQFNILTLDGITDPGIQASVVSWVSRMRMEGRSIIAVLGGSSADDTASDAVNRAVTRSAGFNHEGIVNVGSGVIKDDVGYSSAQTAPYLAGLIAGQKLSESITYASSPFSDVTRRWTKSEMESAVKGGVLLLFTDGHGVKALRGVNTLSSLRQGQNNSWKKIRTIRVMDAINVDLVSVAENNYVGKVNNTEEGRLALIGACKQYMQTLVQGGVIESSEWGVYLDPVYYGPTATITPALDQVYLKWQARLTDAMEQIFGTFIVL